MEAVKRELLIWARVLPFLLLWIIVLRVENIRLNVSFDDWKTLPEAIFLYGLISVAWTRWLWRWPVLQRGIVRVPLIEGTWQGTLQSTWVDPATGQTPPSIPIILVIKQSLESISCVMFTEESESFSIVASITEDDDSGVKKVNYVYINKSRIVIRERSPMHYGAAVLKIVEQPEKCIEGDYWTDRKTMGTISVRFRTKEKLGRFPDDLRKALAQTASLQSEVG